MITMMLASFMALMGEAPKHLQVPVSIPPDARVQMRLLELQADKLRLIVCSEVGIKHTECVVDWDSGVVRKVPPKPEPPKAP